MPLDTKTLDITTGKWLRSFDEPGQCDPPTFGFKDLHDFGLLLVRRISGTRVEKITDAVAVQFGLSVVTTKVTSYTSSTPANYVFPFLLPVVDSSGTTLADLMSGKTVKQGLLAEVKVTTVLGGTNRYYTNVFVAPQINLDAVPDPSITEPATTMSEVGGAFMRKVVPRGTRWLWTDEVTGELNEVYLSNRQWRTDILT